MFAIKPNQASKEHKRSRVSQKPLSPTVDRLVRKLLKSNKKNNLYNQLFCLSFK